MLPGAEHPPLTSLYLTPWSLGHGDGVPWQRFGITLVGAAAVFVIGLLGDRFAGPRVGLLAAGIAAVYPNLWINDSLVMSESLAVLIVAAALVVALDFDRQPSGWRAVALGALAGLGALTRAEIALFAAGFAALAWWRAAGHPRRTVMPLLVLGAERGDRGAMGELQPDPVRTASTAVHERGQHAPRGQLRLELLHRRGRLEHPVPLGRAAGRERGPLGARQRATRGRPRLCRRSPRSGAGCRGGPRRAPARPLRARFAGALRPGGGEGALGGLGGDRGVVAPRSAGRRGLDPRRSATSPGAAERAGGWRCRSPRR